MRAIPDECEFENFMKKKFAFVSLIFSFIQKKNNFSFVRFIAIHSMEWGLSSFSVHHFINIFHLILNEKVKMDEIV